jgi:hypothetical protein
MWEMLNELNLNENLNDDPEPTYERNLNFMKIMMNLNMKQATECND